MAVWLDRAGKDGEHQRAFLENNRIYLTWGILQDLPLTGVTSFQELRPILEKLLPDAPAAKISNHGSQVFAFIAKMKPGDLVVTPLHGRAAIAVGEIASELRHDPTAEFMYRHYRQVKWYVTDLPRSKLPPDIRHSLNMKTIAEIKAVDAEDRLRKLVSGRVEPESLIASVQAAPTGGEEDAFLEGVENEIDLERTAYDDIAQRILQKFKGRGLERLIEGILAAQGYETYRSPEGSDKGVDILAAPGPLGFGSPRICVQVKCTESPVDHPTLSQLLGTMQAVKATQGLLASWGGFKSSVERVRAEHFFTVRLWDQDDIIRELLAVYERLDEDLKAELPLKRIWVVTTAGEA